MHQNLVPDHFLILASNPKQLLHARNSFKNKIFWRGLSKSFDIPFSNPQYFIFSFELIPFYWTKLSKTKELWNSWPVAIQVMKQVQKYFFISYVLSDQIWWCNKKQFLSCCKNYICKLMQASSWYHKLFHFHLYFWKQKLWK